LDLSRPRTRGRSKGRRIGTTGSKWDTSFDRPVAEPRGAADRGLSPDRRSCTADLPGGSPNPSANGPGPGEMRRCRLVAFRR
jgi:hypothetical protein